MSKAPFALTVAAAAVTAFSIPASVRAADVPVYVPPAPAPIAPAPVATWTGPYIGAYLGYTMGTLDAEWRNRCTPPDGEDDFIIDIVDEEGTDFLLECGVEDGDGESATFSTSHEFGYSGFSVGGLIGYNHQFSNTIVLGLEATGGWTNQEGDMADFDFSGTDFDLEIDPDDGEENLFDIDELLANSQFDKDWELALRGRLGFLAGPDTLIYATGGLAWTKARVSNHLSISGIAIDPFSWDEEDTLMGYQIGGGIEHRFTSNLTFRVEALFTDYEDLDVDLGERLEAAFADCDGCEVAFNDFEDGGEFDSDFSFDAKDLTVRAALAYQFNLF